LLHAFLRDRLPRRVSDHRHSWSENGVENDEEEEDTDKVIEQQFNSPADSSQSRLASEFRVLKGLGSGSFGKVFKVMDFSTVMSH